MAKVKGPPGVQNRHLYNRASYLYQAAAYLARQHGPSPAAAPKLSSVGQDEHSVPSQSPAEHKTMQNMSRQMISSMRAVTQKSQIRQSSDLKRTICKFCDTILVEGQTCISSVENASKGGKKPWADVLQIQCKTCGNSKRFPIGAPKQKRRSLRQHKQPMLTKASLKDQPIQESDSAT